MVQIFKVLLLWMAGLGAATQFAKIAVPFADVALLYPDHTGWLLSIISLIGAVLGALSGAIAGRVGPTRLLIFGLVLGGAISAFQASLPGFAAMMASRVVEGVSHLAIVVAAPTLIAQITTGRARNVAMVLWSAFFGVAFALNAWIGLPFVSQFGLPAYFMTHAALMVSTAVLILACRIKVDLGPHEGSGFGVTAIARVHLNIYRSPFISAPAVGWFFYTLTFVSLLAILPSRLPEGQGTIVAGLMPLAGIAFSFALVPALSSVISCVAVTMLGFSLAIAVLVASLMGAPLAVICVALFAVLGLVQGGSFAAVPELNSVAADQAASYGALAQMGNAGNLLGTPILLAVLGVGGEPAMVLAIILSYGLAITAHGFLARRRAISLTDPV
ncbi:MULTISPECIES: MFS transporter [unclassified Ruegeria]|uniref:MFS transporter n=1 Tax=unclassified Ruegeria TaxID=2625375 RepID=UPI0014878843|nr:MULTISPECIES: MFS transporter [unclassified Ruegeria]